MIISHEHKFIFLKTRKTAGTSVEMALSRFCGPADVITLIRSESDATKRATGYAGERNFRIPLRNWALRDLAKIHRNGWPSFHAHSPAKFVRDHVDLLVWREYFKFSIERNPFDRFVSQYYWNTRDRKADIASYAENAARYRLSNWDVYAIGDRIVTDFLIRYERLAEDLATLQALLNLPGPIEPPKTKVGHRPAQSHYRDVIDAALRAKIEAVCAREIAAFGYTF